MFNVKSKAAEAAARIVALTTAALAALCLSACIGSQPVPEDENKELTPAQYMTNVNQIAENLSASLEAFEEAVDDNDLSAMQAKADSAFAVLDEFESMDIPEQLKDVNEKYQDASDSLKSALNDYIALYTEISDSSDSKPFDYGKYPERLESIQKQYDNGLNLLEEADKLAAEK